MAIQYADVLYPVNSTTVDTAAGIDIRLLSDTEPGPLDSTQSVRFLHTNDGVERTFDPATALVTAVADAGFFQGEGWALRLAEDHTPVDNTNCNSILTPGTLTVQVRCLMNMNGGTANPGANPTNFTFRAALYRYNTVSNTGTFITNGSQLQAWITTVLGSDNNTRKNIVISVVVDSEVEFLANEVLLLQLGVLSGTLPNPVSGTTNFDVTLDVDDPDTFLNFEGTLPQDITDQGIRLKCALSLSVDGRGAVPLAKMDSTLTRSAIGKGEVTLTKVATISKVFSLVGKGIVTNIKSVAEDFNLIGKGTPTFTRIVVAAKSFTLDGRGIVTRVLSNAFARTATGNGEVTFTKASIVSKVFSLVGQGIVTLSKNTQAARTFNLTGTGTVTRMLSNAIPRSVVGTGEITSAKVSILSKIFNLIGSGTVTKSIAITLERIAIGKGIITEIHPIQAFRTFFLTGEGEIVKTGPNTSTVTIPIDEVPVCEDGGGTTIIKKAIFIFDD